MCEEQEQEEKEEEEEEEELVVWRGRERKFAALRPRRGSLLSCVHSGGAGCAVLCAGRVRREGAPGGCAGEGQFFCF